MASLAKTENQEVGVGTAGNLATQAISPSTFNVECLILPPSFPHIFSGMMEERSRNHLCHRCPGKLVRRETQRAAKKEPWVRKVTLLAPVRPVGAERGGYDWSLKA